MKNNSLPLVTFIRLIHRTLRGYLRKGGDKFFCHIRFCLLLLSMNAFLTPVWGQEGMLKRAKTLDHVAISGITVFCTSERRFPGLGKVPASTTIREIRFTRSKDKVAFVDNVDASAVPVDKSVAVSGRVVVWADSKRSVKKDYLSSWDESTNTWVEREGCDNTTLFVADIDVGHIQSWADTFLWIIGRGVAERIVDVTESRVETDKDGVRHFLFRGNDADNHVWDIDLLPDKNYMICKAIRSQGDVIDFAITTNGSQLVDGWFFPEHALLEVFIGSKVSSSDYRIANVTLKFDDNLYDGAKSDIDKEMPIGSMIHEESVGHIKTYIKGFEDYSNSDQFSTKKNSGFVFVVIVNVIVILVWIIYVCFCRRRNLTNK